MTEKESLVNGHNVEWRTSLFATRATVFTRMIAYALWPQIVLPLRGKRQLQSVRISFLEPKDYQKQLMTGKSECFKNHPNFLYRIPVKKKATTYVTWRVVCDGYGTQRLPEEQKYIVWEVHRQPTPSSL